MRVGAIDPVGITKASASKVRKRKASTKAMITDSIVSRIAAGENQDRRLFRSAGLRAVSRGLRRFFDSVGLRFAILNIQPEKKQEFNEYNEFA